MAWPFLYFRVRSYGETALFDLPTATDVFTPRLKVLTVEHDSHLADVIFPSFVTV